MSTFKPLASWIALPATFISTLITSGLLTKVASLNDKCLITIAKAAGTFLVVLVCTTAAIHVLTLILSHDTSFSGYQVDPSPQDQADEPQDKQPQSLADELQAAGVTDADTLFDGEDEAERQIQEERERQEKMEYEEERKKIWKVLIEDFKPKRTSLLGPRKKTMVEIEGGDAEE